MNANEERRGVGGDERERVLSVVEFLRSRAASFGLLREQVIVVANAADPLGGVVLAKLMREDPDWCPNKKGLGPYMVEAVRRDVLRALLEPELTEPLQLPKCLPTVVIDHGGVAVL